MNGYRPELEQSDDLSPEIASHYLKLIGILRWAVELGRIEIFTEVVVMSKYSASPRLRHIEALYHMFEYPRKHDMCRVVFDLFKGNIDDSAFASGTTDWKEFMGTSRRSFLQGFRCHWVIMHTRLVLFMITTLVILLLGVFKQVS